MALSDKNILITPNIGSSADPKIVFSGADASTGAQNITLQVYPTNSGTLSFEGSSGQLFSITNSMTGTIYSVNDVSGIPSIEVLDTGLVKLAQYGGNVLLGTGADNATDKLQVNGSISATSSIKGTTLTSTVTTGTAPLIVSSSTMVANLNTQYWNGNTFSSYLNQGVRSGDSPTFNQIYASNWFRNNSSNTGMYNEATYMHIYSSEQKVADLASGSSPTVDTNTTSLKFRSSHGGTVRGWLYADGGNWFGLLNRAGEWAFRHRHEDGYSPSWWFLESGNEAWTGDTGSDEGKIEYHANRFYMVAGTNSDRIVQFRRSGSDVSHIDNNGVYQGTATSLSNFLVSNSTNNGIAVSTNYIGYITDYSGTQLTSGVTDGALYSQYYSSSWQHEIYGDYRSGQIALRGKNNGSWQSWRIVIDTSNASAYVATVGKMLAICR